MPAVPPFLETVRVKEAKFKENSVYHLKCMQISKCERSQE